MLETNKLANEFIAKYNKLFEERLEIIGFIKEKIIELKDFKDNIKLINKNHLIEELNEKINIYEEILDRVKKEEIYN